MAKVIKRGETYYIRYDEPTAPNGKRKQRMLACKGMNKKQAEQKLREILTDIHNGTYILRNQMLFSEHADQWLKRVEVSRSITTWDAYRKDVVLHVLPVLGRYKLDQLRPIHIQCLVDSLIEKGLAPKTIQNIHGIVHGCLQQAVNLQLLKSNPAKGVSLPKVTRPEISVASTQDISKLMSALDRTAYGIPILIVISTGVRRGEVLGLQWQDFNAEQGTLAVRRAFVKAKGKPLQLKDIKEEKSRVVKIPEYLVAALQAHRTTQQLMGLDTPWICSKINGSHMTPGALCDAYRRFRRRLGVDVTLHGLRHTQATFLMAAGVPVKVVSERLGHSTISITMDTYSHVLPHMQDEAAKIIDGIMGASQKPPAEDTKK